MMKVRKPSNGAILLFAGMIMGGLYLTRDSILDEPAPSFSLPDLSGGKIALSSYSGRPVLLLFWTMASPESRGELHLLSRVAPDLRARGFEVLTVKVGSTDGVADYLRDYHVELRTVTDWNAAVAQAYGVSEVPRLILIGPDGKVKRTANGPTGESVLRDWAASVTGS
jgi:peroxiredoxin